MHGVNCGNGTPVGGECRKTHQQLDTEEAKKFWSQIWEKKQHNRKAVLIKKNELQELVLYIDLRPGQTCHSKVMHRKEVTHSDGSYEKKSCRWAWLKKWDKVKFPWYTHRLMHRKRVTCVLNDSYFRLMTIKHAIPKIEWAIELLYNSVRTGSQ